MTNMKHIRLIKISEVIEKTGMSRSTVYDLIGKGKFPQQVQLGPRSIAFVEAEIDSWIRNKIAIRDGTTYTVALPQ